MPKRVYIVTGVAHPASTYDDNYNGVHLRQSEFGDAIKGWKGKDVLLEHDENHEMCGKLVKLYKAPNGDLMSTMVITDHTKAGSDLIDGIESGQYRSLSLGMNVNGDMLHTGSCTKMSPTEISVCEVPGRDGSHIVNVVKLTKLDSSQFYKETMDQSVTAATSRIDTGSAEAAAPPPAVPTNRLESVLARLGMTQDQLAARMDAELEAERAEQLALAKKFHEETGKLLGIDEKESQQIVQQFPGMINALASQRGNIQQLEAARVATELKNKNEMDTLRAENARLKANLAGQTTPGLANTGERFPEAPAMLPALASGGRRSGAVPAYETQSIFNENYKPERQIDFGKVLKKARAGFSRENVTDKALLG